MVLVCAWAFVTRTQREGDRVGLGYVCFKKMGGSGSCSLHLGMDDFLGNS